jgi:hypothetical protein
MIQVLEDSYKNNTKDNMQQNVALSLTKTVNKASILLLFFCTCANHIIHQHYCFCLQEPLIMINLDEMNKTPELPLLMGQSLWHSLGTANVPGHQQYLLLLQYQHYLLKPRQMKILQ